MALNWRHQAGNRPIKHRKNRGSAVTTKLDQARDVLARANRIIANEGVLDAFGHVSMRHPGDPGRYLLSRSRAPELVQPDDILEFTLDSQPVKSTDVRLYGERVIHGGIYQARPDVNAVCHHHAPSILPFCISGMDLKPVYHLGATLGKKVPFGTRATISATPLLSLVSLKKAHRSRAR